MQWKDVKVGEWVLLTLSGRRGVKISDTDMLWNMSVITPAPAARVSPLNVKIELTPCVTTFETLQPGDVFDWLHGRFRVVRVNDESVSVVDVPTIERNFARTSQRVQLVESGK